jgi:hypothetical protein
MILFNKEKNAKKKLFQFHFFFTKTKTHVSFELLGLPVEGVHDLPDGHGDDVDGDEGADDQVELGIFHDLRINTRQQLLGRIHASVRLLDVHSLVDNLNEN